MTAKKRRKTKKSIGFSLLRPAASTRPGVWTLEKQILM